MSELTPEFAGEMATIALGHVAREYPYALVHVVNDAGDVALPRVYHPIFYGSFDWHSCVHGHWLLARVLRLYPHLSECAAIRAHFDRSLTGDKVAGELAYLDLPSSAGFERPYGWAWLLKLAAELRGHGDMQGQAWEGAFRPLADAIARRFKAFLPKADYPVRAGVHSNTAFALTLAHDYASAALDGALIELISLKAQTWYGGDADCQAWEPSGDEFLSPSLMEAELMRRVLAPGGFRAWFKRFLPRAGQGEPATLFAPVRVSDRSDGKIAHLDGLNLSRAWCWRGIAGALDNDDPLKERAAEAAHRHLGAGLPNICGHYMGEHWLASFALLALDAGRPPATPGI